MQNCYTSKKGPKHAQAADPESSHHDSEQDGRLTKKHIETLKFVQEIAEENKLLKIKIEELEVDLGLVQILLSKQTNNVNDWSM